jgi:hypothetical protein
MDEVPQRLDGHPADVSGAGTTTDPWVIPVPEDAVWGWVEPAWYFPPGHYVFVHDEHTSWPVTLTPDDR